MTEIDVGKHCSMKECKQLDFLPFECDGCSGIFCLDHKGRTAHQCTNENYTSDKKSEDIAQPKYNCTHEGCSASELVPVKCALCNRQYCLNHRLPEDHSCENLPQTARNETFEKKMAALANSARQKSNVSVKKHKPISVKQQKMAAKVALMKLKMKAKGDLGIPDGKRVYFDLNLAMKQKSIAIFVNSTCAVGKMIDNLSSKEGIKNTNNNSLDNRLVLCNLQTGFELNYDMTLEEAIKQELIFSGSAMELKYA